MTEEEVSRDARHSIGVTPLSNFQRVIYGVAGYGVGSAAAVVEGPLVFYYNDKLGVSTQYLAIVNFIVGVTTVFTSLVIGAISDRSKARFRRKPYIFVLMFVFTAGLFFRFGAFTSEEAAPFYYAVSMFLQMCGNVTIGVVQGAWAVELANEGADRAHFFSVCGIVGVVGIFFGLALSALPLVIGGIFLGFVTIVSNSLCLWYIEEKVPLSKRTFIPTVSNLKSVLWNNQFIVYISAMIFIYFINTVPALYLFFLTYVMDQGEDMANLTYLLSVAGFVLFGFVAIPLTPKLIAKHGKISVGNMTLKMIIFLGVIMFGMSFLHPMAVVAVFSCVGFFAAVMGIVFSIMQADCIDYDELLTGLKRGSSYGGISGPANTFVTIAGTSVPLALMSAFNFEPPDPDADDLSDERAQDGYSSEGSTAVLRFYCTLFISFTAFCALLILQKYKIDNDTHDEILKNIYMRDAAKANLEHDSITDEFSGPIVPPSRDSIVEDEMPVIKSDVNLSSADNPVTGIVDTVVHSLDAQRLLPGSKVVPAPYITVQQTITKVLENKTLLAPDLPQLDEKQANSLRMLGYYFSGMLNLCINETDMKVILIMGHIRLFYFSAIFVVGVWQCVAALTDKREFPTYLIVILTTLYSFGMIWEILYVKGYKLLRRMMADPNSHFEQGAERPDERGVEDEVKLLEKNRAFATSTREVIKRTVVVVIATALSLCAAFATIHAA